MNNYNDHVLSISYHIGWWYIHLGIERKSFHLLWFYFHFVVDVDNWQQTSTDSEIYASSQFVHNIRSVIYAEPYRNARYSSSSVIFLKHRRLSLNNGLWYEVSLTKWDDEWDRYHAMLSQHKYINLCVFFKQSELIECLKLECSHNKLFIFYGLIWLIHFFVCLFVVSYALFGVCFLS